MKRRYEALLVLDTKGKEDGAKEIIERLEKDFATEGAAIEQIQRMETKPFSYVAGALNHGYFANFIFEGEPTVIEKLKTKLKFDTDVYRQHYQVLAPKKVVSKKVASKS